MFNWLRGRKAKQLNFVILGTQKAGTTSLHHALDQHPDIHMSKPIKEPGYFLPFSVTKQLFAKHGFDLKDKDDLQRQCMMKHYSGQLIVGESSTYYTTQEWAKLSVAKDMLDHNPGMKLVFVYRHPLDRILSHYRHEKTKQPKLTIEAFLETTEPFGISQYNTRLQPYLDTFDKSAFFFISFEELVNSSVEVMSKLYAFLGVKSLPPPRLNQLNQKVLLSETHTLQSKVLISNHKKYQIIIAEYVNFLEKLTIIDE